MENNNNQVVLAQPASQKKFNKDKLLKFLKKFGPFIIVGLICFSLGMGVDNLLLRHRMKNAIMSRPGINRMMPGAPSNGNRNENFGRRNNNNQFNNNQPNSNNRQKSGNK